jgi:glutathione S-transferase
MSEPVYFYYAPHSRAMTTRMLLEELGAPYKMHVLNLQTHEQKSPAYLAVNPMGKVPAIKHGDALITEQIAIAIYLADAFPEKKLAPALDDPQRGTYLRWLSFYAGCFEPALYDMTQKRVIAEKDKSGCPYGSSQDVMKTVTDQFAKQGDYILGSRFSAADIVWGSALNYMNLVLPDQMQPVLTSYMKRVMERPLIRKVMEDDHAMAMKQQEAMKKAG